MITAVLVAVSLSAQGLNENLPLGAAFGGPAPELTQAQRDQFTIAVLAKENAEKAVRLATIEYQKASEHFDKTVAALQVPGYTLQQNRETGKLERVKKAEPEPKK